MLNVKYVKHKQMHNCNIYAFLLLLQVSALLPSSWCLNQNFFKMYVCMYVHRFQNFFLRCPTPRLHCFLSSHWPSFRFLSCMGFFIPSIQFFFGLPRILLCFGTHFNAILGNLPTAIRWIWPYHVSWFCSISFIIVSSSPICCLIVLFLILSFLDVS